MTVPGLRDEQRTLNEQTSINTLTFHESLKFFLPDRIWKKQEASKATSERTLCWFVSECKTLSFEQPRKSPMERALIPRSWRTSVSMSFN